MSQMKDPFVRVRVKAINQEVVIYYHMTDFASRFHEYYGIDLKLACREVVHFAVTDHRFTGYLTNNTKGTSYPAVDSDIVLRGEIPDFDLQRQRDIANVLSAYDDLIENNRRRIQLLEQAARLLYKKWFIYLRFPGHEHVKIKDGVPEGWTQGIIADIGEVVTGKTPSKKKNATPSVAFAESHSPWSLSDGKKVLFVALPHEAVEATSRLRRIFQ